jgi:hypothetical protein
MRAGSTTRPSRNASLTSTFIGSSMVGNTRGVEHPASSTMGPMETSPLYGGPSNGPAVDPVVVQLLYVSAKWGDEKGLELFAGSSRV